MTTETPNIAKDWQLLDGSRISRVFEGDERSQESEVCCIFHGDEGNRNRSRAHLIAAAPSMYQELELAADTFRDFANVLMVIGKDAMSAAAAIAERHIREQLVAIQKAERV